MLALLTAFISVLLNQAFSPDAEQLATLAATTSDFASSTGMGIQEVIQQMTPEQQMVLLKVSAAATFSALVGNVLLVGGMLTLIRLVSQGTHQRPARARCLGARSAASAAAAVYLHPADPARPDAVCGAGRAHGDRLRAGAGDRLRRQERRVRFAQAEQQVGLRQCARDRAGNDAVAGGRCWCCFW